MKHWLLHNKFILFSIILMLCIMTASKHILFLNINQKVHVFILYFIIWIILIMILLIYISVFGLLSKDKTQYPWFQNANHMKHMITLGIFILVYTFWGIYLDVLSTTDFSIIT